MRSIFYRENKKLDTMSSTEKGSNKSKIRKAPSTLFKKCKMIAGIVAVSILINQIPVAADVQDNLSSVLQKLIGVKTDDCGDSFEDSSLHAKLNYQEKQIVALQSSVEELKGQNAAYSLYCYIQSSDTRYEGCELTLISASGNQIASGNLHLDERLDKYVANVYSNFNGKCTLQYGSVKESIDLQATGQEHELKPYISDLTVWIDSTDSAYDGKTITLKDENGDVVESATLSLEDNRYEATLTAYANGTYKIVYPYILSGGNEIEMTTGVMLEGTAKTQQLFGDISQMSPRDVQAACKTGTINDIAKVGDTFSDGTYTYTIIGIDQDTPCDKDGNLLDKSTYGNVLTVMAMGAEAKKGDGKTPVTTDMVNTPWGAKVEAMHTSSISGTSISWATSDMRNVIMSSYYDRLPEETQNTIGYVKKSTTTYNTISVTADKCFLLSPIEVVGENEDNARDLPVLEKGVTHQYQYFEKIATTNESRTSYCSIYDLDTGWWLRSPTYSKAADSYDWTIKFRNIRNGNYIATQYYEKKHVRPAFCIY